MKHYNSINNKATRIRLTDFHTPPMRAFHLTWLAFFLCFFGWFGIAPLMPVVREDLGLTKSQIGNIVLASVAITVFARLLFGWLCDRIGPRISYSILLVMGSIPVMLIGLSNSYASFLLFRLAIGVIGASFVITQYHTSVMFAPNIVGTANAVVAGWGNMGGGAALIVMPLIFAAFTGLGYLPMEAWRYSMILPGIALLVMGFIYYFFTHDTPDGRAHNRKKEPSASKAGEPFQAIAGDHRVWILVLAYGACFGIEITIDNIATLYFVDNFKLGLGEAGIIAGTFGMMNLFARALGGMVGDRAGRKFGTRGRMLVLGIFLLLEGLGIVIFSHMQSLAWAVFALLFFALFLKMSNGATYAVVPFVRPKAMGLISGIVGAGGNVGAVWAGMLFAAEDISYRDSFLIIGVVVVVIAVATALSCIPRVVEPRDRSLEFQPAHPATGEVSVVSSNRYIKPSIPEEK